jgi:uncharacterized membrane protein
MGALLATGGYVLWRQSRRARAVPRPPDSAPGRTARQRRFGGYAVTGRTVTIHRPRRELYDFWRDFSNLPRFMESVIDVTASGDITHWTIAGPAGRDITVLTRIIEDRPGEMIGWRSVEGSDIETEGKVVFRDAPAGRGTEVEAIIAYKPPGGELGRWIAKLFQAEPHLQGRRELKRFKMLMETGEVATSRNQRLAA